MNAALLAYLSAGDDPFTRFVLEHGQSYDLCAYSTRFGPQPSGDCYFRSLQLADNWGLVYVEGFAISPAGSPLPHAWCDESGALADSTWQNAGLAYFGIRLGREYAARQWQRARVFERGVFPLLASAVRGESPDWRA